MCEDMEKLREERHDQELAGEKVMLCSLSENDVMIDGDEEDTYADVETDEMREEKYDKEGWMRKIMVREVSGRKVPIGGDEESVCTSVEMMKGARRKMRRGKVWEEKDDLGGEWGRWKARRGCGAAEKQRRQ